jgi:hypothetical protein
VLTPKLASNADSFAMLIENAIKVQKLLHATGFWRGWFNQRLCGAQGILRGNFLPSFWHFFRRE